MSFIVQKAFKVQFPHMGRYVLSSGIGIVLGAAMFLPEPAFARENEPSEQSNCTDPKHRHTAVRPLTEPAPIRKKDKERVRRVLM
jgi:hypothetical protein